MNALLIAAFYFKAGFIKDVFHTCRFIEILSSPVRQKVLCVWACECFYFSRLYLLSYMFFYGAQNKPGKKWLKSKLQDLVQ